MIGLDKGSVNMWRAHGSPTHRGQHEGKERKSLRVPRHARAAYHLEASLLRARSGGCDSQICVQQRA